MPSRRHDAVRRVRPYCLRRTGSGCQESASAARAEAAAMVALSSIRPPSRSPVAAPVPTSSEAGIEYPARRCAPAAQTIAMAREPARVRPRTARVPRTDFHAVPATAAAGSPAQTLQRTAIAGAGGRTAAATNIEAASQVAAVGPERSRVFRRPPTARSNAPRAAEECHRTPSTPSATASATPSTTTTACRSPNRA